MNIKLISAFTALATFTAICTSARAAVVINVVEQGIDVVANGSGSVDTAGFTSGGAASSSTGISAEFA
jgi:hypothetical protein